MSPPIHESRLITPQTHLIQSLHTSQDSSEESPASPSAPARARAPRAIDRRAMATTMATTMVPMATIGKRIERRGGAVRRSVKVRASEG